MARGIDASAHEAALAVGTVAVMAGGVDIIYPPENEKLYAAIKTKACGFGKCAWAKRPRRAISAATVSSQAWRAAWWWSEAAEKSGSLIAAECA
jgi:DNA processing protein